MTKKRILGLIGLSIIMVICLTACSTLSGASINKSEMDVKHDFVGYNILVSNKQTASVLSSYIYYQYVISSKHDNTMYTVYEVYNDSRSTYTVIEKNQFLILMGLLEFIKEKT